MEGRIQFLSSYVDVNIIHYYYYTVYNNVYNTCYVKNTFFVYKIRMRILQSNYIQNTYTNNFS